MRIETRSILEAGDRVHIRPTYNEIAVIEAVAQDDFYRGADQKCLVNDRWRWLYDPTLNDAGQILVSERSAS